MLTSASFSASGTSSLSSSAMVTVVACFVLRTLSVTLALDFVLLFALVLLLALLLMWMLLTSIGGGLVTNGNWISWLERCNVVLGILSRSLSPPLIDDLDFLLVGPRSNSEEDFLLLCASLRVIVAGCCGTLLSGIMNGCRGDVWNWWSRVD
ncbi:hypothetical protein WICPIJ_009076 [Wickerhamomyces pijperi]|uniref:Transmembrane protein n=1 Tax=Wickerhamomyces pijperi TaxID=599730 RepID=A0A9P8PQQ6_WICPI|nr:hypothetical protein WICPIJ_009076 [Wickerhamomyces pijperi]